jgi:uncharacterized protein YciI
MEFVIIAYDGKDEGALARRMAVREEHLSLSQKLKNEGKVIFGGAILDDSDKMIGSIIVCDFESRQELDQHLKKEPYVNGGVWQKIEIHKFHLGKKK